MLIIPKLGYRQVFGMFPNIKLALDKINSASEDEIEQIKIKEKIRIDSENDNHIKLKNMLENLEI